MAMPGGLPLAQCTLQMMRAWQQSSAALERQQQWQQLVEGQGYPGDSLLARTHLNW